MAIPEIHVGDVGTVFNPTMVDENGAIMNLATATTLQIWFAKPDGTVVTKTATLTSDGTDGKMQYSATSGDLSRNGLWSAQPYVEFTSGASKYHGKILQFFVTGNLQ